MYNSANREGERAEEMNQREGYRGEFTKLGRKYQHK
jgi:hypothetical protein